MQPLMQVLQDGLRMAEAVFQSTGHIAFQVIQSLLPVLEFPARMRALESPGLVLHEELFVGYLPAKELLNSFPALFQEFEAGKCAFGNNFRGGTGRGRPDIRDKIGDGKICLVPNGGDNGDGGFENCAGDDFLVEGPQIFERAAATGNQN